MSMPEMWTLFWHNHKMKDALHKRLVQTIERPLLVIDQQFYTIVVCETYQIFYVRIHMMASIHLRFWVMLFGNGGRPPRRKQ